MKRRITRFFAAATLVGVLATSFAVPAFAASYVNIMKSGAATIGTDIGNEIPQVHKVGGEIVNIQAVYYCDHYSYCDNMYYCGCNQYIATGTSSSSCELPYSKFTTAGPAARTILADHAAKLGLTPGGAFGIEIGRCTCYSGYTPCSSLQMPMNYDIHAFPMAGTPVMLALTSSGTVALLNDNEFVRSGLWYPNGTTIYTLHTLYPDAVYMIAYAR